MADWRVFLRLYHSISGGVKNPHRTVECGRVAQIEETAVITELSRAEPLELRHRFPADFPLIYLNA